MEEFKENFKCKSPPTHQLPLDNRFGSIQRKRQVKKPTHPPVAFIKNPFLMYYEFVDFLLTKSSFVDKIWIRRQILYILMYYEYVDFG